ncbi:hypothetical protein NUU61_009296 [Penicillium alfredii]|uniref:F-box domain-containing protein n=1 Tax=Penicillium alfredii TaxID=1506179 RepID=A0A9W9EMS0_9EURO|nr:uncharacterized protein NUU61_009296 [Penicillium alfredii]KAJ5084717.1 hypothetical protein NUU61_009296 [Penicillium alfredii]
MLSELPSEIIYHIATFLPTANALTHLAQTCHRLYEIITAEDSRIFRAFVQSSFPCTPTPPFWKDAARALTARSRALDRQAIIGRFVLPPPTAAQIGSHQATRLDRPTLGYRAAIDSYETWNGACWADRKEVLAWGAASQLVVRVKQSGAQARENWFVLDDTDHTSSYDDILGVHALKPDHGRKGADTEHFVFGRMLGDIVHLAISPEDASHEYKQRFRTYGLILDRTDLSDGTEPTLAAHYGNGSIAFYHTATEDQKVEPFVWLRAEALSARNRYSKLLSSSLVAVGTGDTGNSLSISTFVPDGVSVYRDISVDSLDLEQRVGNTAKANVSAIAPLNQHALGGSPGDVFLAAWGDRSVRYEKPKILFYIPIPFSKLTIFSRLHDLRSPHPYESTYRDTTDINPIYSVHTFGHDRFLAGAGGDAVLKIFDLRMSNTYSYLDAQAPPAKSTNTQNLPANGVYTNGAATLTTPFQHPRKDISIFLSHQPPSTFPPQNQNHNQHHSRPRKRGAYRGPIYTMSSPSPSSSTVYTGIVDGVVRLDFASTDDLTGPAKEWYEYNLDLGVNTGSVPLPDVSGEVFNLAGYERPHPDDLTTTSKLRNQRSFWSVEPGDRLVEGWDARWEHLEEPGAWRRRDE